jgi:DNA helicase HerA-like ATPase
MYVANSGTESILTYEEDAPSRRASDVAGALNGVAPETTHGPPERRTDFDPSAGRLIGLVERVDADRVDVALTSAEMARHVNVSSLVALPTGDAFTIAIVESLCRTAAAPSVPRDAINEAGGIGMRALSIGTLQMGTAVSGASFVSGASCQPQIDCACHVLEDELLSRFMSLLGDRVPDGQRLTLGHFETADHSVAIADGNLLLQRHMAILGNTGSGKSWTVALLLERAAQLGNPNIIVLDVHSEYGPLARSEPGRPPVLRRLRTAGPEDMDSARDDVLHLPFWLLEFEEFFSLVTSDDDPYSGDQREWLLDRIETLKRSSLEQLGNSREAATSNADSPVPYVLDDLLRWLESDDVEVIIRQPSGHTEPGPYAGKLRSLIARLRLRASDPRYAFIFRPPDVTTEEDWLVGTATKLLQTGTSVGIKAIDLSEVPSAILPMVTGVLVRFVYNVQFWMRPRDRTPLCIVCDEAHLYLSTSDSGRPMDRVALECFEAIAKQGRKYGVCLAVVSQRPSEVSTAILSQCNNFVVLRIANEPDQRLVEHLISDAFVSLTNALPTLKVGEAIVFGDAVLLPVRIRLDPPSAKPASGSFPYWSLWSSKASSSDGIAAGVDALRAQRRDSRQLS